MIHLFVCLLLLYIYSFITYTNDMVQIRDRLRVWVKTGGPREKNHQEVVHIVHRKEIIDLTSDDEKELSM